MKYHFFNPPRFSRRLIRLWWRGGRKEEGVIVGMDDLLKKATEARENAYAPYSGFKVGAALETEDGKIYTGCNVENAAYSPSICAERVAVAKAVSDGERKFRRILIVADTKDPCPPCGVCRQVLVEFNPKIEVILANVAGKTEKTSLSDLLPSPFVFEK